MKIMIDERDTRDISFKALGFLMYLKANTKTTKEGNILNFTKITKDTGIIYRTLKSMANELEEKEYIKTVKRGIPVKIYVSFLK